MRVDKKFIETVREHIGVGWSFKLKGLLTICLQMF